MVFNYDEGRPEDTSTWSDHSKFSLLNEAHLPAVGRMRTLIEDWYSHFPAEGQAHLLNRLRSGSDSGFQSAFAELYWHETMRRYGCDIAYEPEGFHPTRRPDFFVTRGEITFVVEVAVVIPSDSLSSEDRRKKRAIESLSAISAPRFSLMIQVNAVGPRDIAMGPVRSKIMVWLNNLDPDSLGRQLIRNPQIMADGMPHYDWSEDGWNFHIRPIPLKPNRGEVAGDGVGFTMDTRSYFFDSSSGLRSLVKKKASRYGDLGIPYMIAASLDSRVPPGLDHDVQRALYGSNDNGILSPSSNRGVSAVVVCKWLHPNQITVRSPSLWINPWARNPLDLRDTPWTIKTRDGIGGESTIEPDIQIADFFGLEPTWPYLEDSA